MHRFCTFVVYSIMDMTRVEQVWKWMEEIADPEVPVLSIVDLGIVRNIVCHTDTHIEVFITPTYSGCPAMDLISMQIKFLLIGYGVTNPEVHLVLDPPWTTDWMSEAGKEKLRAYGIAPPKRKSAQKLGLFEEDEVACPHCGALDTSLISKFGATSCKAMYQCKACKEPFEHFKCH